MIDCNIYTTPLKLAAPVRMPTREDAIFSHCIVVPENVPRNAIRILRLPHTCRQREALAATPLTRDVQPSAKQSALLIAMEPLRYKAPKAYDLLATKLTHGRLDDLFAKAEDPCGSSKDLKSPFAFKEVKVQVRKLTLHSGHDANSKRRNTAEVNAICGRYPELQHQTKAFCALCVVLEWWIEAVKIDAWRKVEQPSTSALETKLKSLGFCESEIKAIRKILRWLPRGSMRTID